MLSRLNALRVAMALVLGVSACGNPDLAVPGSEKPGHVIVCLAQPPSLDPELEHATSQWIEERKPRALQVCVLESNGTTMRYLRTDDPTFSDHFAVIWRHLEAMVGNARMAGTPDAIQIGAMDLARGVYADGSVYPIYVGKDGTRLLEASAPQGRVTNVCFGHGPPNQFTPDLEAISPYDLAYTFPQGLGETSFEAARRTAAQPGQISW